MTTSLKKHISILNSILLGALLLGVLGCGPDDPEPDNTYDQEALLRNMSQNLILPAYEDLNVEVALLETAGNTFATTPDQGNLEALRTAFRNSYLAWMECSVFEFGPAADRALRAQVNTWPTDVNQITTNIGSGSYDLSTAENLDAKGWPAVDYLLYGIATTDADIVDLYATDPGATSRLAYLQDVLADVKQLVGETVAAWENGYTATYENASGSDVGSSLGQLVNQFNFEYEILKKPRLGIPLGKQTLGQAIPENVEAYYSGLSLELLEANFEAIMRIYYGQSEAGVDGFGLHEALQGLNATYNGGSLAETIDAQIKTTRTAIQAIPGPLSETVTQNPEPANLAYNEVQKLLVLFKTDMTSALGVLITYVDNDGD